ncbi:cell wall-binding repeat-containing protein [Micromonospora sp. HK10]|uniref:cell wall-binding repeat-containing protein n=1 Tax=Micromonospora sp. HK10 TaxID=1538294 RepID=UPI0018CC9E41|nr:cell wall-binding repeat-containing protein [Micromonospora sp. HK10]
MPPHLTRRPVALAAVSLLVAGTAAVTAGAAPATAGHSGTAAMLSASDGGSAITFADGTTVRSTSFVRVGYAAWSPDGSLAAFVTQFGDIRTLRHDDADTGFSIAPPGQQTERRDPHWIGDSTSIVWSAKPAGDRWRLELNTPECCDNDPIQVSPSDGRHYLNPDTADSQQVVAQRQADDGAGNPTGTPEIGFVSGSGFTRIAGDAANPALSPDGSRVAFVRGGQIWVADTSGGGLVQVTSNAVAHDNPDWSPDGTTIAFNQCTGTSTVATAPADGSRATAPQVVAGLSGVPAYQPRRRDHVVRLAGADRFGTAVAASRSYWGTAGDAADKRPRAGSAVLTRSDTFADALGGSALAAAKRGPLLMTPPDRLNAATAAEIKRVLPPGGTVFLLGSTGALAQSVQDQIAALGYRPIRLAGADRFATATAIANLIDPTPDLILAATGMDFPDALTAGAAAGSRYGGGTSAVVVLTNDGKLPPATKAYLDAHAGSGALYSIGRQAVAATAPYEATELWGDDRFGTAAKVNWTFFGRGHHVGLVTAMNWPDALAGGALMAQLNGPLLLTAGANGSLHPDAWLYGSYYGGSVHTALVFGSSAVVGDAEAAQLGGALSGPLRYDVTTNGTVTAGIAPAAATGPPAAVDPDSLRVTGS